jgi:beta-N-acetylhexosaminidase
MRFALLGVAIFSAIGLFIAIQYILTIPTTTPTTETTDTPAEEKPVGRHFMIGHWADTPVASTTDLLVTYQLGGIIIMSAPKDPNLIKEWVTTWQAAVPYPLMIAIDQEGGVVSRLVGPQFDTRGQRLISTEADAYALGRTRGAELAALGITMNFAPVLDTATHPDSFLYNRVFPSDTVALARAMTAGLAESGVTAVVKHFPGHADTPDDSHHVLPHVDIPPTEKDNFIAPFRDYVATAESKALMTAHVVFPNLDPLPATLSPYWLQETLRKELDFTGLIITDDLSMKAIADTWSPAEASRLALAAGADVILLAAEPTTIITVMDTLTNQ